MTLTILKYGSVSHKISVRNAEFWFIKYHIVLNFRLVNFDIAQSYSGRYAMSSNNNCHNTSCSITTIGTVFALSQMWDRNMFGSDKMCDHLISNIN